MATQCDGIAIASYVDGYRTWKQVARRNAHIPYAPLTDELPTSPNGEGLPCNLMNDILVTKDDTVYVATTAGLVWSSDRGATWDYVRGADYKAKAEGSVKGTPLGRTSQPETILSEDYCTVLAENAEGNLMIGHRAASGDIVQSKKQTIASHTAVGYVTSLLSIPDSIAVLRGTYGAGLQIDTRNGQLLADHSSHSLPLVNASLPARATSPSMTDLATLNRQIEALSPGKVDTAFLTEDWATQGDWTGRYGHEYAMLCGAASPFDHVFYVNRKIKIEAMLGPHCLQGDSKRNWLEGLASNSVNALWDPEVGVRRSSQLG